MDIISLNRARVIVLSLLAVIPLCIMAQSPQQFNYQGVARDNNGDVLSNQSIGLQLDVRQASANGTIVFTETHATTTNAFGLFNISVGGGTPQLNTLSAIDWSNGPYFLEVSLDATGGTNYQSMGVSQLLSVPYALYAENVNPSNLTATIQAGSQTSEIIVVYTSTNAYGFAQFTSTGSGDWTSQTLSGTPIGAIASGSNIVIYTSTNAYAFSQFTSTGNGDWTSQSLSGTPLGAIASGNTIVVYTSSNAYGYSQFTTTGAGDWTSQSLSGTPEGAVASAENIVVYTPSNAYGFSQFTSSGGGDWTSQSLSGTTLGAVGSGKNIVVYTTSNAYAFSQFINTGGGDWTSQSLSGTPINAITR